MDRRTVLKTGLAALGTLMILPKVGGASGERKLTTISRCWGYYKAGYIKTRWIPKEYLVETQYNMELEDEILYKPYESIKVKPNVMIFVDMKDGEKYMYKFTSSDKGVLYCLPKRYFL